MAQALAGDDGSWGGWNSKWHSAATSSTQKSRGWKSSPQKTSESGKEAEWWSVGHNSEWLNSEWHNKTGTWQDSSWSRSTWKSSKMAPGPPGSPRNVDSNSEDVRGDGEEEDKDESEEDAARI